MAKKKTAAKTQTQEKIPFESAISELEVIVRRMEGGAGTLDESLDDYSKAIKLLEACHKRLSEAQRRVEVLTGVDADGNPITEPLDESPEELEQKQAGRSKRRSSPTSQKPAREPLDDGLF
ncbi:MAG: hypothetical protein Aurels2KO_22980 [Aureliella sp.]